MRKSSFSLPTLDTSLLIEFLSQPTVPFREQRITAYITALLTKKKIPFFLDRTRNLVIGAASEKEYLRKLKVGGVPAKGAPQILFVAHLDHPGFIGEKWLSPTTLQAKWHGGSPMVGLEGQRVWLSQSAHGKEALTAENYYAHGTIKKAVVGPSADHPRYNEVKSLEIEMDPVSRSSAPTAARLFGGFAFRAPAWQDDKLVYTKAADDLIGCFSILSAALRIYSGKTTPQRRSFLALLTRAEEVGFIGAIAHLKTYKMESLKRPPLFVSFEASRTLPNAEIGKGPVIRLGDASGVFSARPLKILLNAAKKHLGTHYQRRIMDGGTCEATPAIAHELTAIGVSVPLGNYHNIGFEGGPDASPIERGPAPEFVNIDDIAGQSALVEALLDSKLDWKNPWKKERSDYKTWLKESQSLLNDC